MIDAILKKRSTAKSLVEYWEYGKKSDARVSLRNSISAQLRKNRAARLEKYLDYIATRPRAEKIEALTDCSPTTEFR